MRIPSEMLMEPFAEVIGVRFSLYSEDVKRGKITDEQLVENMLLVVTTLGDMARAVGATHAGMCCQNEWRKLRMLQHKRDAQDHA